MFGNKPKKDAEPKVTWDVWNERFEFHNGNTLTCEAIKDLEFYSTDLNMQITVDRFLKTLFAVMWEEGENFNPKRPFGISFWKNDMIRLFILRKIIEGQLDDTGDIVSADLVTFNYIIKHYIGK